MTLLQWGLVAAAGVAGYAGVSWLIDRGRGAREKQPPVTRENVGENVVKPPRQATGERSAWDEFKDR
jgi:hypothetical protein